ncbi:MAG: hypothetical protein JKY31_00795 [Rhodobacteraceae bacterium]|nr:hypothetical protein [Paracoccaceae bacterium]
MRTSLRIIIAGLTLAACGPLSLYYRPGVSVTRMQTDTTNCEVAALKEAPIANELRQRPPIFFPGSTYCDASGYCTREPGYWIDGGVYTVDVNQDLRGRVADICMAKRGYQPVTLPACPSSVANSVPAAATVKLPTLTSNSCVIRYKSGNWQIVIRG